MTLQDIMTPNGLMAHNDIYIWASYASGAFVLITLALKIWRAKKNDERILRELEQKMRELSKKQV